MSEVGASARNAAIYETFWQDCPDFPRYNPGSRHRRRRVMRLLREIRFETVLDVGCGHCELLAEIEREYPNAHLAGADVSPETVKQNGQRHPQVPFHTLDIARKSLDQKFDLVVCSEVVEHLDDRPAAFGHLAEMVRPGGHLLITCPTGRLYETERRFGHVSHPDQGELSSLAAGVGMQIRTIENWGWPTYRALKWATNVDPNFAVRNFASQRYSLGAKAISTALYWLNWFNLPSSASGCQIFALLRRPTG